MEDQGKRTDRIRERIAADREEILDFVKGLVAIPTENPPGSSYRACIDRIAGKLAEIGLDSTVIKASEPVKNGPEPGRADTRFSLLSFLGKGPQTLYFHGHYDVVPAVRKEQFSPYVKKGMLFGRGAADMKSGLAAMIYAVKALKDCEVEMNGRIGLTIVPDEETGGAWGSKYLAQAGLLGKDGIGMLMPEPTSGVIWNASRGAISLRVTVKGKPAHVGLHYEGINAFEGMLIAANAMLKLKEEVEARQTGFQIEPEEARRSILLLGGRCEGGANFNLVPGECSFTVDRRINPEEDLETEKKRLFSILDRLRRDGIDMDVEVLQEGAAAGAPKTTPLAQALVRSAEMILGRSPALAMCPGLLEIRFYAERGIPALAFGPGLLSVAHGPHESVRIEDIYNWTAIYALTAVNLLGSGD